MAEPVEAATLIDSPEPAEKPIQERLEFRGYVDLPEDCEVESERRGGCDDPEHFHAWCRLPNGFQRRDIVKKARAAQGRIKRRLREEGTDDFESLEEDIDDIRQMPREQIVDGLVGREALHDLQGAVDEVKLAEDSEFALIDEDIDHLRRESELPEDERDAEEIEELTRHTKRYWDAVQTEVERRQKPRRDALLALDEDALIDKSREDRIEARAADEFVHVFGTWRMYLCTYDSARKRRKFESVEAMQNDTDADVVTAIRDFFDLLERGLPKGSAATRSG